MRSIDRLRKEWELQELERKDTERRIRKIEKKLEAEKKKERGLAAARIGKIIDGQL